MRQPQKRIKSVVLYFHVMLVTHTRDTHTMTCINTLLIYDISDLYIINKLLQSFVSLLDDAE